MFFCRKSNRRTPGSSLTISGAIDIDRCDKSFPRRLRGLIRLTIFTAFRGTHGIRNERESGNRSNDFLTRRG